MGGVREAKMTSVTVALCSVLFLLLPPVVVSGEPEYIPILDDERRAT